MWDTRAKSTPVQQTSLSANGHTHPVYSVQIVGTSNAHNLVTISTDGKVCSWTLDNLSQPLESLQLENAAKNAIAPICCSFPSGQANYFYMGTEEGAVYQGTRHGSNAGLGERFHSHFGPITSVDFHPPAPIGSSINFSHLFLTSSFDWSCALWTRKNTRQPLCTFPDFSDYVYDAKWSPVHPAVFATADGSGKLDVWNLNEQSEKPVIRDTPSPGHSLNKISWSNDAKNIAAGSSDGQIFLYGVGEKLSTSNVDDERKFEETCKRLSFLSNDASEDAAEL